MRKIRSLFLLRPLFVFAKQEYPQVGVSSKDEVVIKKRITAIEKSYCAERYQWNKERYLEAKTIENGGGTVACRKG